MNPKALFMITRTPFLLLTISCTMVGFASAVYDGYFNLFHLILALIGSLLAHVSVNVLNEYFDFKRGTDFLTQKTPFSGGSGALPSGLIKPQQAYWLGVGSLIFGLIIGTYFILLYPILIPIIILASLIIYFYTPLLVKIKITEIFPGLAFGPLLIIGAYITQLPSYSMSISLIAIAASIPPGLLTSNLLLLNELPDYEADLNTGRKHAVIILGREKASKVYVLILALTYLSIIISVLLSILPITTLVSLLTLPLAVKASKCALKNYDSVEKLIPSLAQNTIITLLTPLLIALGLILAYIF